MELLRILGTFLIINAIVYLLGSFIAFDMNPTNWSMFLCAAGRSVFIILEIFLFGAALKIIND
jgi:hypothetical protein